VRQPASWYGFVAVGLRQAGTPRWFFAAENDATSVAVLPSSAQFLFFVRRSDARARLAPPRRKTLRPLGSDSAPPAPSLGQPTNAGWPGVSGRGPGSPRDPSHGTGRAGHASGSSEHRRLGRRAGVGLAVGGGFPCPPFRLRSGISFPPWLRPPQLGRSGSPALACARSYPKLSSSWAGAMTSGGRAAHCRHSRARCTSPCLSNQ
jgi:hypothetical protein